jgi:hypothetical protein
MLCASARSANFGDARLANRAPPRSDAVAPVKRIDPEPRGTMCRAASCPTRNPAKHPTRHARSKSSGRRSRMLPGSKTPALNTATSIGPSSVSTLCNVSRTAAGTVTSHAYGVRSPPANAESLSALRASIATRKPASSNFRDSDNPSPGPTPAITAELVALDVIPALYTDPPHLPEPEPEPDSGP